MYLLNSTVLLLLDNYILSHHLSNTPVDKYGYWYGVWVLGDLNPTYG